MINHIAYLSSFNDKKINYQKIQILINLYLNMKKINY